MIIESLLVDFDVTTIPLGRFTFELSFCVDIALFNVTNNDLSRVKDHQSELRQSLNHTGNALCQIIAVADLHALSRTEIFRLGFDDFVCKPLLSHELKRRVEQAVIYRDSHQNVGTYVPFDAPQKNTPPQRTNSEYVLVENATKYLLADLNKKISLSQLTKEIGTNRNKLSQAFKTYYGETPHSWVRKKRLTLAAELLATTELSIHNIAIDVGYPDPNNFSTAFKRYYKVTPFQFRTSQKQRLA